MLLSLIRQSTLSLGPSTQARPSGQLAECIPHRSLELLQWIALASLTLDYLGAFLLPGRADWLRSIGQISFPLFALVFAWRLANRLWLDANASLLPMAWRLGICAIVTHLAWIGLGQGQQLNIVFGFLAILCIVALTDMGLSNGARQHATPFQSLRWALAGTLACLVSSRVEFGAAGVLLVLSLYAYVRFEDKICLAAAFLSLAMIAADAPVHDAIYAVPVAGLVMMFNLGVGRLRHLFYWLYPMPAWLILAMLLGRHPG